MMPIANSDTPMKNERADRFGRVGEQAERSAGIADVGEVKETVDHARR